MDGWNRVVLSMEVKGHGIQNFGRLHLLRTCAADCPVNAISDGRSVSDQRRRGASIAVLVLLRACGSDFRGVSESRQHETRRDLHSRGSLFFGFTRYGRRIWYNTPMERIDDLQLKGLSIIQDTELFCFGTDAVLLADFVRLKRTPA